MRKSSGNSVGWSELDLIRYCRMIGASRDALAQSTCFRSSMGRNALEGSQGHPLDTTDSRGPQALPSGDRAGRLAIFSAKQIHQRFLSRLHFAALRRQTSSGSECRLCGSRRQLLLHKPFPSASRARNGRVGRPFRFPGLLPASRSCVLSSLPCASDGTPHCCNGSGFVWSGMDYSGNGEAAGCVLDSPRIKADRLN